MDVFGALLAAVEARYDTLELLKESPRGSVAVIRSRRSGTRYILRQFTGSGQVYQRLLSVTCPHLPRIYEAAHREGRTAVLEEYIPGDTLAFLLSGGPLPPRTARDIARQLCQALWTLHALGIVHRDLKPDNVLLRGNQVVLVDFDAARLYGGTGRRDTQVLGTTGYAAPEQYGISPSDQRADIYALGVLLNIMLTGRHPTAAQAPGRMGRIVRKCTMTNPAHRYQSVLSLLEAL